MVGSIDRCQVSKIDRYLYTFGNYIFKGKKINFKRLFHGPLAEWEGRWREFLAKWTISLKGARKSTKKLEAVSFHSIPGYLNISSWVSPSLVHMKRKPVQIVWCLGRRSCSQEEIHRTPWKSVSLSLPLCRSWLQTVQIKVLSETRSFLAFKLDWMAKASTTKIHNEPNERDQMP